MSITTLRRRAERTLRRLESAVRRHAAAPCCHRNNRRIQDLRAHLHSLVVQAMRPGGDDEEALAWLFRDPT